MLLPRPQPLQLRWCHRLPQPPVLQLQLPPRPVPQLVQPPEPPLAQLLVPPVELPLREQVPEAPLRLLHHPHLAAQALDQLRAAVVDHLHQTQVQVAEVTAATAVEEFPLSMSSTTNTMSMELVGVTT